VPSVEYAEAAHAGALSFEFSHRNEFVVGNCGPAPAEMENVALRFREGIAHSTPTINGVSAATVRKRGPLWGRLASQGAPPEITLDADDDAATLRTHGFEGRFGVTIERQLTLLAGGRSLVGQDRLVQSGKRANGSCVIRFHLAPGAEVEPAADIVRVRLASGALFAFLWEGAQLTIDESIRQSAHFGFHRTRQIVLAAPVRDTREVSWIFTLEDG
jgi:uncharacterized heparinase superfamily protein